MVLGRVRFALAFITSVMGAALLFTDVTEIGSLLLGIAGTLWIELAFAFIHHRSMRGVRRASIEAYAASAESVVKAFTMHLRMFDRFADSHSPYVELAVTERLITVRRSSTEYRERLKREEDLVMQILLWDLDEFREQYRVMSQPVGQEDLQARVASVTTLRDYILPEVVENFGRPKVRALRTRLSSRITEFTIRSKDLESALTGVRGNGQVGGVMYALSKAVTDYCLNAARDASAEVPREISAVAVAFIYYSDSAISAQTHGGTHPGNYPASRGSTVASYGSSTHVTRSARRIRQCGPGGYRPGRGAPAARPAARRRIVDVLDSDELQIIDELRVQRLATLRAGPGPRTAPGRTARRSLAVRAERALAWRTGRGGRRRWGWVIRVAPQQREEAACEAESDAGDGAASLRRERPVASCVEPLTRGVKPARAKPARRAGGAALSRRSRRSPLETSALMRISFSHVGLNSADKRFTSTSAWFYVVVCSLPWLHLVNA